MSKYSKPVLILAGGFGTRLQTVLGGLPKPLADINGSPFISFLIKKLIQEGYNNFIFSLFYKPEKIVDFIENSKKTILRNCMVDYCIDPQPLGTGGAICLAVKTKKVEGAFLIVNADTILEHGYKTVGQSKENTIGLVKVDNMSRYGRVIFDDSFLVQDFIEKKVDSGSGYINAGIYNLHSQLFFNYPETSFSLESHLFPELVKKQSLYATLIESSFIDIGVPYDYYKFCSLTQQL
jgi:D-glycero-alpha-D-manno-heptose 1-phosphate guanylyltransferase